jgi:hypothetical protein
MGTANAIGARQLIAGESAGHSADETIVTYSSSALAMHDSLLTHMPDGANHSTDTCLYCTDWAMTAEGIPAGTNLESADSKKPYGQVTYADPGYQSDGVHRYPVDTEAHAKAAWSYINQSGNVGKYSTGQLGKVRSAIVSALKKFGVKANEKSEFNKDVAESDNTIETPNHLKDSVAAQERRTKHMEPDTQETISAETHKALLDKALRDSTAVLEADKAELTKSVTDLNASLAAAITENERINGELDTAQVALKAAQDEAAALKADIAAKEAEKVHAETASARAAQVRTLGLFEENFITERASKWAEFEEASWAERLEEWKVAKGTSSAASHTDTASAMTGIRDIKDTRSGSSARRTVLGLPA